MGPGNVFAPEMIDRGPAVLYHRIRQAAGSTTQTVYQFFSEAIGPSVTKVDTNLVQANRLPPPQAFQVVGVGFQFGPGMVLADIEQFLLNYYFEFKIGMKVFLEGPLSLFPAGGGIGGFTGENVGVYDVGLPVPQAVRYFENYPRIIPPNVYFGVQVQGDAFTLTASGNGGKGLQLMACLFGIWDREVQ